jgi:uncharacterized membrane protein YfcA
MVVVLIGSIAGVLYGVYGAGGSALATPLLALAGIPSFAAVASPLPATLPAALAGAWAHRHGSVGRRDRAVLRAIAVGLPAAAAGALASSLLPGTTLLALSTLLLAALGVRFIAVAIPADRPARGDAVLAVAAVGAGFLAGLLANGGGLLLMPLFVLLGGRSMREAASASLLVAGALTVPTLLTHWALGHVDWSVTAAFAVGLLPGTLAGARVSRRVPLGRLQRSFGLLLLAFAAWFAFHLA